jgi:hypothetical protein
MHTLVCGVGGAGLVHGRPIEADRFAFLRSAPPVLTALRRAPRPAASHVAGPVKAVIFDWAGTIVDHGSTAPVQAFIEAFKRFGDVTIDAVSDTDDGMEVNARAPHGIA